MQTTSDLYAEHTAFNLPYVSVKRRGLNYRDESASVGVVRLSSRYFGAMRLLGADEVRYGGLAAADGTTGGLGGLRLFRFADDYPQASRYAAVSFTDRNYLAGTRLSGHRTARPRLERYDGSRRPYGARPARRRRLHQCADCEPAAPRSGSATITT